ncbi:uncharacterized protein LOC8284758 [Ricinus communis]|uniref:Transmembrane protein n=1 Tax=Ricinus communis TaxID=3988 RepID=B9T6H0_RICCO|nr:uncharacterized protein LOC8284758 [Ricinus communis]XP_025015657.1 uncharacterized protein LOC8284758 [Ricinus communis]XP_025015658.1 uncharacterized protein LOC8284758 [Ricinus communis]EEF28541.1 conserved hypothetical protein [Ricinus communis]|eukprot:XP_002533839.1 uncharacterized protein LOC8284758 [Ricinus communis]
MGSIHKTQVVLHLIFLVSILGSHFIAAQTVSTNSSEPGTDLLDRSNVTQSDDTVRVDPLDNFKKYRGGYDITNKHYWSSTVFTGIYGYAIGILWLLAGIVYGGVLIASKYCCKSRKEKLTKRLPCHKQCYLWPILLAIIFTVLTLTASGLVLGGNQKFRSRARTVVNIIIDTADGASGTIYNTTGAMKEIRDNLEASNASAGEASSFLTSTAQQLDNQADEIHREARKHRRLIEKGLKIVYIITTVTISLNLVAITALSVCGTLRLRRALNLLIVLCWILTALCWLFFGVYFFLGKFSGDTCTALENFQINPYNNSLSSILPCDEMLRAKPILTDVSEGIYNIVNQVNTNISVVQVCNPFSGPPEYQYQADNCPANTIKIGDIPKILEPLSCSDSNNGTCGSGQFISTNDFEAVEGYTTSLQNLLNAYPGMESLVECQSVKDAFSEILTDHCKPLKKYVRMTWGSMLFLSLSMVFLVLIWTVQTHHEQEHHSLDNSVKPHSSAMNEMDSGERIAINSSKHGVV